jgi:hypothetical protein
MIARTRCNRKKQNRRKNPTWAKASVFVARHQSVIDVDSVRWIVNWASLCRQHSAFFPGELIA